jgi:hypothetical protein
MKKLFFLLTTASLFASCANQNLPVRVLESGVKDYATGVPKDLYTDGDTILLSYDYYRGYEYARNPPVFDGTTYLKVVELNDSTISVATYYRAVIISRSKK